MFSVEELVRITCATSAKTAKGVNVKGISTDSRTIKNGEAFIALKGKNFNGEDFVFDAWQKGAAAAVVSEDFKLKAGLQLIKVKDTLKALTDIAKAHRRRFDIPIIAVTGSNGKTTTKDMAARILSKRFKVLKTRENENNSIGVSLTLLGLNDQEIAVVEVGTNSFGEVGSHSSILKPTVAVITNIGDSHLEGLRDRPGVLKEKLALIESLPQKGIWVKNCDDDMIVNVSKGLETRLPKDLSIITYGIREKDVDFRAENIRYLKYGTEFDLISKKDRMPISLPLLGIHNVYNILAAIACCSSFMDVSSAKEAISLFKAPHMRMEVLDADGITIINDSYNSNPTSLRYAFSVLKEYPAGGKRIAVVADMLELGDDSLKLHYESGKALDPGSIEMLVTYGENSIDIARGALKTGMDRKKIHSFIDKKELMDFLRDNIEKGDVLLIKGSRGMKMEEILDCFTICSTL